MVPAFKTTSLQYRPPSLRRKGGNAHSNTTAVRTGITELKRNRWKESKNRGQTVKPKLQMSTTSVKVHDETTGLSIITRTPA